MATGPVYEAPDYGDFVDSDDECEVETEAELRARYFENLYCPLNIGLVLNDRYRIEHKLGWGGFSTVWLACDMCQNKTVALKVMSLGWRGDYEHRMHNEIIQRSEPDTSKYLVTCLGAFYYLSRRGNLHTVLVLPLRGPSVKTICSVISASFRVPAAKHLLLAVKRLHDAGIVHSDINSGAAMWGIDSSMENWSTAEIYNHLGRPRKVSLTEEEGGGELVELAKFPQDTLRPSLHLGDFGHAFVFGTATKNPIQYPIMYCAPERLHGINPSFASDLWSFTCVFVQLYLGIELTWGDGLTFISRLVGALGPFPEHWKGYYPGDNAAKDWWYDHTGRVPRSHVLGGYETLEAKIDRLRPDICKDEREHALAVMRKGFHYIPEKRITAAELLVDPSFNALMAYYAR